MNLIHCKEKTMKKLCSMLVPVLMVALLLPACAPAKPAKPGCTSEEVFCVGLVTNVGKIDDQAFNQAAWEGLQKAEKDLGAQIHYMESVKAEDYARNISTLANEGYDVIVTVGVTLAAETVAAAKKYQDIDFIGVDQFQAETLPNLVGLNFPEDQAGFLVGALAAAMSKSQKIGAVCPSEAIPSAWRFAEGYKAGAAYADQLKGIPTEVMIMYHLDDEKDLTDPQWGDSVARSMRDQGVDVIFGCGGQIASGALTAAAETGAYAIGADTDQYLSLPEAAPRMLSSAIKHITPEVFELIQFSKNGEFPSGNYFGKVGYAPYHDLEGEVPLAVKTIMEQIEAGLLDGSIQTNVPSVSN
jgi:basic membrane protein A and related proteins